MLFIYTGRRSNQDVLPRVGSNFEVRNAQLQDPDTPMMPAATGAGNDPDPGSAERQTRKAFRLWVRLRTAQEANWKERDLEGIGKLPQDVRSCTSMLLFNTGKNPYMDYMENTDNLVHGAQSRRVLEPQEGTQTSLADAPSSLVHGAQDREVAPLQFGFKPAARDLDFFELPENIPLPNVVDVGEQGGDMNDDSEARSLIPSEFQAQLPEVPRITDYVPTTSRASAPPSQSQPPPNTTSSNFNDTAAPPPPRQEPPPPPRDNAPPLVQNQVTQPAEETQQTTLPPPPGPPRTDPPPRGVQLSQQEGNTNAEGNLAPTSSAQESSTQSKPVADSPIPTDLRADIRKMSLNKLKPVSKKQGEKKKDESAPTNTVDAGMSALQEKLKRRRQDIKGKNNKTKNRPSGSSAPPKEEERAPVPKETQAGNVFGSISAELEKYKDSDSESESDSDTESD